MTEQEYKTKSAEEWKTFDEILDELKCIRYRPFIKKCMKAAAAQAVRMALEEAAKYADVESEYRDMGREYFVDPKSILSLEAEIIAMLK